MSWPLEVLSGLGAGLLVALLARFVGVTTSTSPLEGMAFALMWILTGLFLRRRRGRR
jgi:hypothetical protein